MVLYSVKQTRQKAQNGGTYAEHHIIKNQDLQFGLFQKWNLKPVR